MRLASDGKPFDIDNLGEPKENEVEVIQYLSPNGKRRRTLVDLGEYHYKLSQNMIISSEIIRDGRVAIYCRFKDQEPEDEICFFAKNGPGEKSPVCVLTKLIQRVNENRGR